jgi:hypothetical protein
MLRRGCGDRATKRGERFHLHPAACDAALMERSTDEIYLAWAMISIGVGIATAGGVGLALPLGHRLAVVLALVLGAGVGIASWFALMLMSGFEGRGSSRSFLIASVLGLAAVVAGLVVLMRRSRAA